MADTDEASVAFAHDAENAVQAVSNDVAALSPILRSLGYPGEIQLLEKFQKHFAEYKELDRRVLELAVENTNLKAQRLSFGPAQQAADAFRDALASVAPAVTEKNHCQVEALVAKATLAVREIQIMQAPHIAEANDEAMMRMEKEMADKETSARQTLQSLADMAGPNAPPGLASARAALDRFKEVSSELVKLSRRNSNVLSLDLSLRPKPVLAAQCDDGLRALQEALAKEGSKATR